ncbi:MAG: carotenoid oxygenase family protein [Pseudomonadota bacterium]|nr:carotenoid oxygenase family protein [Pseudomonadota bacterium]MEC8619179.1 carotenoid oxygenase family protein [Pseudomonadota bacterium]MEC8620787.1 carotenoid oxygenase family protein [Pseudomonadota bacterium]
MAEQETINQPWFLRGNWRPTKQERTETQLAVQGKIPPDLSGVYLRTGPNPKSGTGEHWFLGDGMVHGIRLSDGKAQWYKNRFLQTPDITNPLGDPSVGLGDLRRGKGNTHVVAHNKKILCLEEAHWPWEIDAQLNTVGCQNFNEALTCSMTAHPKVCPNTGELLAFSYFNFAQPYLNYICIGADGELKQLEGIELPQMVMMHDFNITENYVVFMDLPLALDLDLLATGIPFRFKRESGARLGVMPRSGTSRDVRWFEIDPCYVFHQVNAWDKDGVITLYVSRQNSAFGADSGDYSEVGRLHRWTIDLRRGSVSEQPIDDRPADFGRVNDNLIGKESRFGYLMALEGEGNSEEPVYGPLLYQYDLHTGKCAEHDLGEGTRGAEPVFVPATDAKAEDEGWVLSLVHSETTGKSRLIIVDAQEFASPPVATIELPFRVPYGAHGNWVADIQLQ